MSERRRPARAPTSAFQAELLGRTLRFEAPHGLFSQDRIDDGTRLLLENLPVAPPSSVLDLGCGYGALGLPIAARHPGASCLLVDRDVVATRAAARNAARNGLSNAQAVPGLGYRDLSGEARFDWVLCNVPARIGEVALHYLLLEGARRLTGDGALRVVVINDLRPAVERCAPPPALIAAGARHAIYELGPLASAGAVDHESLYLRDTVTVGGMQLERPSDSSEDPDHLEDAVPLLLELLPRSPRGPVVLWRAGYGAAASALVLRGASVLVADRDLLALAFARRNALRHRPDAQLQLQAAAALPELGDALTGAAAVVGEAVSSAGEAALALDVVASARKLGPGAAALWLGRTALLKPLSRRLSAERVALSTLASRGAWSVWRATGR